MGKPPKSSAMVTSPGTTRNPGRRRRTDGFAGPSQDGSPAVPAAASRASPTSLASDMATTVAAIQRRGCSRPRRDNQRSTPRSARNDPTCIAATIDPNPSAKASRATTGRRPGVPQPAVPEPAGVVGGGFLARGAVDEQQRPGHPTGQQTRGCYVGFCAPTATSRRGEAPECPAQARLSWSSIRSSASSLPRYLDRCAQLCRTSRDCLAPLAKAARSKLRCSVGSAAKSSSSAEAALMRKGGGEGATPESGPS